MALAIFDLDHTLLGGDSDQAWGLFLADLKVVDAAHQHEQQERYYADYVAGRLDIHEFLRFQLQPLRDNDRTDLEKWRTQFLSERVLPMISDHARKLVEAHRRQDHTLIIITATNEFITQPIADEFGVDALIATKPEEIDGRFTGAVHDPPSFREGKVELLNRWLRAHGHTMRGSWFYTDSHNDLPLLRVVDYPVAVNPDPLLVEEAERKHWPILDLTTAETSSS